MSNTEERPTWNEIIVDVQTGDVKVNGQSLGYIGDSPVLNVEKGIIEYTVTLLAREIKFVDSLLEDHLNRN